ncbi:MAG: transglycosylase SLT domain-containing protein [Gemmatimonadota bacterium]|nr:transglycosylase SLT domain-containing protein [Gemmatimonadota bacterium]
MRTYRYLLPLLAAVASLGFEHAEAGILRDPPVTSGLARATSAELALLETGLRRTATIRDYAERYRIGWTLAERIHDAAIAAGIDVDLAYRLVRVESRFRHRAIGPAGSIGLSQVQPETARWLDPTVSREDLFDTETNLRLGFGYLRLLIDRYGSTRLALLAYNRGPGTVHEVLAAGEDPSNGYAARVLGSGAN